MTTTPPSQTPWRVLGGRLGAHTSARSASVRRAAQFLVLLSAIPVLVALALREWCLRHGFSGQPPLWRACYSDLPSMLGNLRLGHGSGDPIVTSTALGAVAELVGGVESADQVRFVLYWAFLALLLVAVCTVGVSAYLHAMGRAVPDRALLFVLSPALPLGLLISGDIIGVSLMVLGLLAWLVRRDLPAGVLLALAAFSRGAAVILVVVVIVIALRVGRPLRTFLGGVGVGLGVVAGLGIVAGAGALTDPVTRWVGAVPGYGSLWVLPSVATSTASTVSGVEAVRSVVSALVLGPAAMTVISVIGWVGAVGLVWWLSRRAFRPSLADLALAGVAVVLLFSPALPVQASLWLVPLVALSSLPRRDVLLWAGAEVLYFPMVWLYLGGLENPDRGLPGGWYALFLLLRVVAIGYLVWRVAEHAQFGVSGRVHDEESERGAVTGSRVESVSSPQQ